MTNTDTADVAATVSQIQAVELKPASELVRNHGESRRSGSQPFQKLSSGCGPLGVNVPIIGDFHYNGHILLTKYPACAQALDKYRINPGNVG